MFTWFNNLKIRNKLITVFLVMIGLTIIVSVIALISQSSTQNTVDNLLNVDVYIAKLSLKSDIAMLMARRNEKDYQLRYKELGFEEARAEYVDQAQMQVATIHANIAEIKRLETHAEDIALAEAVDQAISEYASTFLDVVDLLELRGYVDTGLEGQFREKVHEIEAVVEAENLDQLTIDMLTMRRHEKDYLLRGEEQYVTSLHETVAEFKANVVATDLSPTEQAQLVKLADDYQALFDQLVQADVQIAASVETYREAVHKVEPLLDEILVEAQNGEDAALRNMESTAQMATLTVIGVSVVAAVIGLLIAFFLSRSIAKTVNIVARAAEGMAEGNLDQTVVVNSKDELGNMAAAFQRMIANLRNLIGQVQQSAEQVADASQQLNTAADQTGQASQQVSTTIQQIAQSTTQQTQTITEATNNAEQMARAAEGIARGAQEQAAGMQKTSGLIAEMDKIVDQVNQVAGSVTKANSKVNQAAQHGVTAVEQTGRGMENIRAQATTTAQKVKEMGIRSKEIGRIVETIDNIADKTDMLALNAAVEAARAGEHGRGFAVVADQVRKLSEDSKEATRDISDLIERVQETVNEAIAAMDNTVTEVDSGTKLAGDTAQSLQDILQAAEEAVELSERINQAVALLKQKSEGVVSASETVSAVVEENTAVSEQMAANSQEVTDAMEGVASIAEENSAATEEVSASAEEMAAQIEEVVASAEELSALAEELRGAAAQFRVG